MIATLVMVLLAQTTAARPAEVTPAVTAPGDWLALPELRYRRRPDRADASSDYVRDEVRAGRCTANRDASGAMTVRMDMAVLVSGAGPVRRIVPRAIGCPTVEQYATGLVERLARDNLDPIGTDAWFHTALDFAWRD